MIQDDYIVREIDNLSRFLSKIIFRRDLDELEVVEVGEDVSPETFLYSQLKKLVAEKRINEAENLLFEEMEISPSITMLKVALKFYMDVQRQNDSFLNESDFTREEILDGLKEIDKIARGE